MEKRLYAADAQFSGCQPREMGLRPCGLPGSRCRSASSHGDRADPARARGLPLRGETGCEGTWAQWLALRLSPEIQPFAWPLIEAVLGDAYRTAGAFSHQGDGERRGGLTRRRIWSFSARGSREAR